MSQPFVVAVPVGPAPGEVARAADLLAALRAWEPEAGPVVLVDDAHDPDLAALGAVVLPNPRAGRGIGAMGGTCAATLTALRWAHEHAPGAPVLRLDSDALVIGPFAARLRAVFAADPAAGVLGSCDRTCNGDERVVGAWAPIVRRHAARLWLWRRGAPHVQQALRGRNAAVRREVHAALAAGHPPGRHCIAAACALSGALVGAMARAGMLDDPLRWVDARIGDDVMLGLQAAALGFALRGMVADGEPFGLAHVGLPDAPERLVARGFALVHSLRNDPRHREDELRAFFAARRPAAGPGRAA
jgi:hypothetical protein